jgi:hypothetical protein
MSGKKQSPLATGQAPGTLLAQCGDCNAVKIIMGDGAAHWQHSIAVFSNLSIERCNTCVNKHGDRGITPTAI